MEQLDCDCASSSDSEAEWGTSGEGPHYNFKDSALSYLELAE